MLIILWPSDKTATNIFSSKDLNSDVNVSETTAASEASGIEDMDEQSSYEEYIDRLERKLEQILSGVKNVGNVNVMITLKDNGERVVEKDYDTTDSTSGDASQTSSSETTVMSKEDNNSLPYVKKVLEPEIEGVLVSCQGGGNPDTVVNITEAVQALFDVPAHKIVVLEEN
jgi:stage III sporulation protein AG